jgi:hypothetical protein
MNTHLIRAITTKIEQITRMIDLNNRYLEDHIAGMNAAPIYSDMFFHYRKWKIKRVAIDKRLTKYMQSYTRKLYVCNSDLFNQSKNQHNGTQKSIAQKS